MNAKKLLAVLITLILTTCAFCLPQEDDAELSHTMQASCVIKIVTNPDILPRINIDDSIYSILTSSNLGGRSAREILEVNPGSLSWEWLDVYVISRPSMHLDVYEAMINLSIDLRECDPVPAPAAEEFLFALVEGLRQSLNKSYEDSQRIWTQQIEIAEENIKSAETRLRLLQAEQADLRAMTGLLDLSRDALLKDANNIKTQITQEEFNLSSMDWSRDRVLSQMRFFHEKIREEISDNIVLNELQRLVDIQTKELEKISELRRKGVGGVSVSDDRLIQAEEKLAKAKIELAQKKQQITNSAGGKTIDQLKFQLNNFEINKIETEKKLQYLHEQLANTKAFLQQAEQYEILSLKIQVAKRSLKDALYKVEEVKQQLNTMAPTVILVGSE